MQSEIQKTLNLSRTVNSPVVKPSVQPNLDVSRPIKPATKHRKNERQQLIAHLEEIVDVQANFKNGILIHFPFNFEIFSYLGNAIFVKQKKPRK